MASVGNKRSAKLPTGSTALMDEAATDKSLEVDLDNVPELDNLDKFANSSASSSASSSEGGNFKEVEIKKRPKVPEPPARIVENKNIDSAFEWMVSLTTEHWEQLSWFLYRQYPKIDRPPNMKNIDKGGAPINRQWLLNEHGSGDYKLILNNSSLPKNKNTMLTAYIKLDDVDYPPKVVLEELDVNYPGNKRYVEKLRSEGKLNADGVPMTTVNQGGNNNGNDQLVRLLEKLIDSKDKNQLAGVKDPRDSAITEAFSIIGKGNEAATRMMLDQMKENSPDTLIKLVTLIMGLMDKKGGGGGDDNSASLLKMVIDLQGKNTELMISSQKTQTDLLMKLFESKLANVTGGGEKEDGFEKYMNMYAAMSDMFGGGGGRGGKKGTLEVVLEHTMPVAERIFGTIQNLLALRMQAGGGKVEGVVSTAQTATQQQQQQTQQQTRQVESGGRGGGKPDVRDIMLNAAEQEQQRQNQAQAPNGRSTATSTVGGNMNITPEMKRAAIAQAGPMIINAMNRNVTGSMFAESIENTFGAEVYDRVAAIGEDQILQYIKENEQLWGVLGPVETNLKEFLKDFIAYGSEAEESGLEVTNTEITNTDVDGAAQADVFKGTSKKRGVVN